MDANATPDPTEPTGGVSRQDSSADPHDTVRAPNDNDPDIDETSSVSDMIVYGRHSQTEYGKTTRIAYLWRRRTWKALYLLKQKPKEKRRKGDFGDLAESFGYSRSNGYKMAHLLPIIDKVDAFAQLRADQSRLRRVGVEEWPSDDAILIEFPSPFKKTPRSAEERQAEKQEEEDARARARANRNADDDDTLDADELADQIAVLKAELAEVRAEAQSLEQQLQREREQREAEPPKPEEAQVDERVLAQDSDPRQLDLFSLPADPIVKPVTPDNPVTPDPATFTLSADAVPPDHRDDVERRYKLTAGWAGVKGAGDIRLRNIRAHFYVQWGGFLKPDQQKAAEKLPKKTWRDSATVADVLTRLAALMASALTGTHDLSRSK